jgi:hypothetical protein
MPIAEELQSLRRVAARQKQACQLGCGGAAGVELERLRSESSSSAAASSSAGEGAIRSRNCSICGGRMAPVNSATTSPSRNALTAGMPLI